MGRLELSLTLKQNEVLPGAKVSIVLFSLHSGLVLDCYELSCD